MSYTFSRRAFFKYSAAAAVAVAGASLLSGCELQDPNNPSSKKLGQGIAVQQVTAILETFDMDTGAFRFSVLSSRVNPLRFDSDSIAVTVLDADGKSIAYYNGDALNLSSIEEGFTHRPYLQTGDSATVLFNIAQFTAVQPGQTVRVQYIPVSDYTNYSMTWAITREAESES